MGARGAGGGASGRREETTNGAKAKIETSTNTAAGLSTRGRRIGALQTSNQQSRASVYEFPR